MNNNDNIVQRTLTSAKIKTIIMLIIALLLLGNGAFVIFVWHNTKLFLSSYVFFTTMAYNTAICMILLGISLPAIIYAQILPLRICSASILIIGMLRLIELFVTPSIGVSYWFSPNAPDAQATGLMSPTTTICYLLLSISIGLLSTNQDLSKNRFIIAVAFFNMMTITITFIALIGHGMGLIPAFTWLGIKMAAHTATGLLLASLAILIYVSSAAEKAFNNLNFFSRMVCGFTFMAILVTAVGSLAFTQINTVSAITHELYQNPLQINNAAVRIKSEINNINRHLKNIAIRPEISEHHQIPQEIFAANQHIENDIELIRKNDPSLTDDLGEFLLGFNSWKKYVLDSYELLKENSFEKYSLRTVYDGQEKLTALDMQLEAITKKAQARITELNKSVADAESDAKKLVVVIVIGFLTIGAVVAFLITRSLTGQLQKIRYAMLDIAHDDVNSPIPFLDHTQEIGDMARALEIFAKNMIARRQLETRLLQVLEAMPNGIIMIGTSGTIEIVNAQTEKIFGYERQDILGQPIEILIPKDKAGTHFSKRNSFFANPSPRTLGPGRELFGLRKDGNEFPIEIVLAPVDTIDGLKALASITDITERRNATAALNKSRERLEVTARVNQIGIWEYNTATGELIWDDTMFEIYGRSREYFTANYNAWRQSVHPDDLEHAENILKESLTSLSPFICKFRIIQPNGNIKYIMAKAKIERSSNNELQMLGTNIDITREELAFEKLHNLEALRSSIIEFSEDAIISKTPLGIITSWNTGAKNMFGYTAEEAIGKPITDLLFPADRVQEEEALLALARSGTAVKHFETVRRCKDGHEINVSITLSPIKDVNGNVTGVSAIKRDMTESIKTAKLLSERQEKLEISNHDLERSNKELETFAYVASHDLKSPLRGIAQLSTWIEEDLDAKEYDAVKGHTDLLRNRIQRMEKLLDDLLIFYRAGKVEGSTNEINVYQMAKELFDIQNTNPGLTIKLADNLPVFATLNAPFEQVIRNLFSNAIKHHDKNEGIISLSCKELDDKFFEFSLSDDGPGIPEKFQQRIFGMFQTLKPRDEMEGSGMGLALIKKIVENYGGKVTLVSSGRGSCFSFSWPKNIRRRQQSD